MSNRGPSGFLAISGSAALFLGVAFTPSLSLAQSTTPKKEEPPAVVGQLTVGQQIASDNGELIGITPIDLTYKSGTRSQTLEFNMSLPVREGSEESDNFFDLREPQAMLHYRLFTKNSGFETRLTYRKTDLDREIYFDDISEEIVTLDQGSVSDSDILMGYAFGNQAKLGGEFTIGYNKRDYTNTADPDLYDRQTTDADFTIYLEPTPVIRARLLTSATQTDSDGDGTDSQSLRAGAGATMQVDKLTQLDSELAWTDIQRETEFNANDERAKGLSFVMKAERARPNGDWTLSFASDPGTEGRRERLTIGRNLKMPRYDLAAAVGSTRFQGNYDPIFEISYNSKFSEVSEFKASLRQQAVTDNDGDEAINTDLSTSYRHNLGKTSSLGGNIRYRASNVQTGDRADAESIAFDVNYSHKVSNDISLTAGANMIKSSSGDDDRETDDKRVYLGISRSFDFLP